MQLVLYASSECILAKKVEATAAIADRPLARKEPKEASFEGLTFRRYPALKTPSGLIGGSNAALRYLAMTFPHEELYGSSLSDHVHVDSVLDAIQAELETPIIATKKGPQNKQLQTDIIKALEALNKTLTSKTFLVGERMTIADIAAASAAFTVHEKKLCDITSYAGLVRLVKTVGGRVGWKAEDLKASSSTAGNSETKSATSEPKKSADKKVDVKENAAPPPKARDPIEDLPPSEFDTDAWKRCYSNSKDLKGEAMPYLWSHYDAEGWSFWHLSYARYNEQENTKALMASNLLGMFLQRVDNWLRKFMFGVCNVLEEPDYFGVEGVILVRGQEIPKKLQDHDQFDSFTWRKLDAKANKKLIEDFFCESDQINGKNIVDCKVYK